MKFYFVIKKNFLFRSIFIFHQIYFIKFIRVLSIHPLITKFNSNYCFNFMMCQIIFLN